MTATACAQFLGAAQALLSAHPGVDVVFSEVSASKARIEAIWSHQTRQSGAASRAMRALMCVADDHALSIELVPHWLAYDPNAGDPDDEWARLDALNEQKLTNEQLQDWYNRLGFVKTGRMELDDPVMERQPLRP